MAPPYSDPGSRPVPTLVVVPLFPFPTLPALSLRAVGYHMPPFVHSGGDSWAHPAGGIWSPPSPQS